MFTLVTHSLRRIQGQCNQRQTSSSIHTDANVSKHSGFIPKPTERPMQTALKGISAPPRAKAVPKDRMFNYVALENTLFSQILRQHHRYFACID